MHAWEKNLWTTQERRRSHSGSSNAIEDVPPNVLRAHKWLKSGTQHSCYTFGGPAPPPGAPARGGRIPLRVQNSPSGRVEGMEARRTRGARLRRGIPPRNKELNGSQGKATATNKPSPACASTTPSKLLPCNRSTPTARDVEKRVFAARRARKWVKETWRAEQGAVQRTIRGPAPPRCEVHPTNHRQRLGVELTRDPYAEKGVYFLRENY